MNESPKKKQVTKDQHWLPRTYLREFTQNKKLHAYKFARSDKANFFKRSTHEHVTVKGVAHSYKFYEAPGLETNAIENALAYLEDEYRTILDTKILKKLPLTEEEHDKLATFISVLQQRTTAGKANINDFVDRIIRTGKQIAIGNGNPEAAARHEARFEEQRKNMFAQLLITSLDVDVWGALDFCFLFIPNSVDVEFVTSDNPVSLVDWTRSNSPYGLHPWSKTAESVVPLTPKIALFGNRAGITGYEELDYNFARDINLRTVSSSQQLVISKKELEEREVDSYIRGHRLQSLLLRFVPIPDGRIDRIIAMREARDAEV